MTAAGIVLIKDALRGGRYEEQRRAARIGACFMVGGTKNACAMIEPLLEDLAVGSLGVVHVSGDALDASGEVRPSFRGHGRGHRAMSGADLVQSIFEPVGQDLYVPTEAAVGPWTDAALHGGPPAMLLAREIERFPSERDMVLTRLTVELLRPVARAPLTARCRVVRAGRKVQLVEASLWREDVEVARATALRIRHAHVEVPGGTDPPPHPLSDAGAEWTGSYRSGPAYHLLGVEIRAPIEARPDRAPNWAWVRLKLPLVPGEDPTPLVRVCSAADFPNGISYVVDPRRISYINPDLTLYLHRSPVGEWVMVDARTWLEPNGTGLAEGALYDEEGRIGRSLQALLVEPRTE